ncbi:MAG: hypothetical protein V8R41_05085 [Dorea formicigenerans]
MSIKCNLNREREVRKMRVITVVSICIAIFFAVKSWRTAVILRAVFYFMVDKGYTAPTQREIEQCISIVTQKTIEDWIK